MQGSSHRADLCIYDQSAALRVTACSTHYTTALAFKFLFLAPLLSCQLSCVFKHFFVIIYLISKHSYWEMCYKTPPFQLLLLHHKPSQNLVAENKMVYHFSCSYRLGASWAVYLLQVVSTGAKTPKIASQFPESLSMESSSFYSRGELLTGWLDSKTKHFENVKKEVTKPLKVYLGNRHTWTAMFL